MNGSFAANKRQKAHDLTPTAPAGEGRHDLTPTAAPREPQHDLTPTLLARYDRPGPRYTSYPTAVEFHDGVDQAEYVRRLARADLHCGDPLSLYVHLPFCEERCAYCGCNVVITKHRDVAERYLDYLDREIDLLAAHLPNRRIVSQLHWGGGTPTYYTAAQLDRVFARLARHFAFTTDAEIAVEIDPRVTSAEQLEILRSRGFNRLSMGVQDFAPEVQAAVNRIQSYDETKALVDRARELGYRSINIDLIYGLPYQTLEGFSRTLAQVLSLRPERVAVYSFAYVPWMKAHMKHLPEDSLPGPDLKIALLEIAREAFLDAGYCQIGMDHFAVPEDELAQALDRRVLHRNFMGYTVQSAQDMVALGVSGIGDVQGAFVQNTKKLNEYYEALDAGHFPVERGYALDRDDEIRRHVITTLMCNGHLDVADVERRFDITFAEYFGAELAQLTGIDSAQADGLVTIDRYAIDVTPLGRFFVRNICMAFDRYLRARTGGAKPVFSRTV
jgi:oxygen-independent coproporphyrinogen III oxidase